MVRHQRITLTRPSAAHHIDLFILWRQPERQKPDAHLQGPLGDKPGSCQADPNNRTIVVMISDSCPECEANHLDLQALTWEKVMIPGCLRRMQASIAE